MVQSPGFGVGNGLDKASGAATKNTKAPHSEPPTRTAEREIWSAEIAARTARMQSPCSLSDDDHPPCRGSGPTVWPVSNSATMFFERDYFRVNRPDAAGAGRSPAVALEPFRSRPAHVVAFRPISARQQPADRPENGDEIHPRTPHTVHPMETLLTGSFGQGKEDVRR